VHSELTRKSLYLSLTWTCPLASHLEGDSVAGSDVIGPPSYAIAGLDDEN
jgi:hypothetical protein